MNNFKLSTFRIATAALLLGFGFFSTSNAIAQNNDLKRFEVSGSYTFTKRFGDDLDRNFNSSGWTIGTGFKIKKWVTLYAEAGQDYSKTPEGKGTSTAFLGGVRFHILNKSRVTPFVQSGIGVVQYDFKCNCVDTDNYKPKYLALSAGGGVDVALNRKKTISWRTSVEYRRLEYKEGSFRLSTGIVFNF